MDGNLTERDDEITQPSPGGLVYWALVLMGLAENLATLAGVRIAALCVSLPGLFVILALEAFAGCTRCVFWADSYRALGGIATISNRQLE